MTTRALVTGGNGFVAQWAMRAMLEQGWEVFAAGIGPLPPVKILSDDQSAQVRWRTLDITDQASVGSVVEESRPDVVLHLAAISHVPDAMKDPAYAFSVNALGVVRLLSEVGKRRKAGIVDPAVLVVGSAEQYGRHEVADMPLAETAELRPLTMYAASKTAQEVAALQAFRSDGMRVVCTRSFNHSGAGHPAHFLIPGIVGKAMALRKGGATLAVGNTDVVRDFLHVSDVVSGYLALLARGVPGEVYNVSSGAGVTVREIAEAVMERVGVQATLGVDPAHARAVDVQVLVGNNMKLRNATGWEPRRTRLDIIDDLIHAATR